MNSSSPPHAILAIIPAHNEASRIVPVIQATLKHLPVLVVDDGSSDNTPRVATEAGATVIRQIPNQGKGTALKTGFRYALEHGFEAILTLDADGQHDPAEIPLFLDAYTQTHADLIIGTRNFSQMPLSRRLANTLGQVLFSWAVGQPIRDNQSGYRLLSRRMAEVSLESPVGGFEFEVEMIVLCLQRGYLLSWVPIRTIYAGENSHISPLQHVQRFIRMTYRARRMMKSGERRIT